MADPKHTIAKLEIIKELATENSVKQLADVMISYIKAEKQEPIGFSSNQTKANISNHGGNRITKGV